MLIVRTTKARQSNLHDAGTLLWFTAGFGCKPPEIYPASTEPYWARINNRVVIYTARGIHDSHSFPDPDLRVFSGKTGMVAKCLGRGLVGGMGTLCCALLLVWYLCFVFMAPPRLLNALAMPPGLVLYVEGGTPSAT